MPHRRIKKDTLSSKYGFETSAPLKQLFTQHFESWAKSTRSDLIELADKLGVTPSYLGQVRRYGRIPSKPVLILISLLFKASGEDFFRAAGIRDPFPFEPSLQITQPSTEQESILSLRFNTDLLAQAIRSVVRSELRTRSVKDVLGERPLRIGVNYHYYWLFEDRASSKTGVHKGIFPDFCSLLATALQKEVELVTVPFLDYIDKLKSGQIDLFGPMMVVPNQPSHIHYSVPLFRLGISALFRKKEAHDLPVVPEPKTIDVLKGTGYKIAVVRNSHPQLLANTLLKKSDSELILCASDEEGIERVTLRGIARPAHIFLTNSATAFYAEKEYPKDIEFLFGPHDDALDHEDCALAVRPDWPEVVPVVNDAIRFLQTRGGFTERLREFASGELHNLIELI